MTVFVVYFTNKLLLIPLSWHLCCQIQERGHVEIKLKHDELSPRPDGEADCELRANRLAEVQGCADPLNANNQARAG